MKKKITGMGFKIIDFKGEREKLPVEIVDRLKSPYKNMKIEELEYKTGTFIIQKAV